jgi:hypothetical protein
LGQYFFIKMKRITTQKKITMRKFLLLVLLLAGSSLHGFAQADCFEYDDEGKTIIKGLTVLGSATEDIEIPAKVTKVKSGAFVGASASLNSLIIEEGGNPEFEANLFGTTPDAYNEEILHPNPNLLGDIQILGSNMTVENIGKLFASLVEKGDLSTVYIDGYSGTWSNITSTDVLTSAVSVTLPATLVSTQVFGDAQVYGRFTLEKSIITFSGNATFQDTDNGSNMLFYVATNVNGNQIHVKRVDYVRAGQGILIHNAKNTSSYADLPRKDETTYADDGRYADNKFVGMPNGGTIYATETIGNVEYTNFILSNGLFYPTETGTIRANRAFLRLTTGEWDAIKTTGSRARNVGIVFDDDETTDIETMSDVRCQMSDVWYDLSGRKIVNPSNGQMPKGIYIQNGKKYVVR